MAALSGPSRSSARPSIYSKLAAELRRQILQGKFGNGQRLPTEAELAQSHQVSRQTVRRAFQDLVAEGLVFRTPGRGTFTLPKTGRYLRQFGSIEDLMGQSVDTSFMVIEPLRRTVNVSAASRLRLPSDTVHSATFLRSHGETPLGISYIYLPPAIGEALMPASELTKTGSPIEITVIRRIEDIVSSPIAEAEQSITVARADPAITAVLGCPLQHPVLRIDRLYIDLDGHPAELSKNFFLPEHYTYRTNLRRNSP
jgi:DNA-binding GntR family transcriptional regulator